MSQTYQNCEEMVTNYRKGTHHQEVYVSYPKMVLEHDGFLK